MLVIVFRWCLMIRYADMQICRFEICRWCSCLLAIDACLLVKTVFLLIA